MQLEICKEGVRHVHFDSKVLWGVLKIKGNSKCTEENLLKELFGLGYLVDGVPSKGPGSRFRDPIEVKFSKSKKRVIIYQVEMLDC